LQFNYSCFDYPKDIWTLVPVQEILIKTSIVMPVALFGVIGNCLLLHVILGNRAFCTPTNMLISNMAVADLLVLVVCPGLFLFHEFFQSYRLGPLGCKLEGMFEVSLLVTSVITLCFISYDRLTAIAFPFRKRLTYRSAKIVIAASWLGG